jgi:hypothetical protein
LAFLGDKQMSMMKIGSDGRAMSQPVLAAFLDEGRGLMWASVDVAEKRMTFDEATKAVKNFKAAGFDDWRLPTIDELETLRDRTRHSPAADPELGLKSEWYWSSTTLASSPGDCAWGVNFDDGYSYWHGRSYTGFVRAVRSARASQ